MDLDTKVTLFTLLGLLFVNLVSLGLAYLTPYGKSWIYNTMKTESKGYYIFWNLYMPIFGITFWIVPIFEIIRYGKIDIDDMFKKNTFCKLYPELEIIWKAKKNRKA